MSESKVVPRARAGRRRPGITQPQLAELRMTLGRVGRVLRQQNTDELGYALISLLLNISRSQPVAAGELAESEGVSPPSVTRSLNRLVELGLVSRELHPADRRTAVIRLTEAGQTERDQLLRRREVWLSEHLDRLTQDELDSILNAMPALRKLVAPEFERGHAS